MKLRSILNNNTKHFPVGFCLLMSTIISGVAFSESSKDGFPPLPDAEANNATTTKAASTTRPSSRVPTAPIKVQRPAKHYYYPQQMQGYRPYPYAYYPQQQMPNYAPRQWVNSRQPSNTPRYQPYAQKHLQAVPYRPYPVTPYYPNQKPYRYPQIPTAQQNNKAANTATNTVGKKLYPMRKKIKKEKQAWGDERHIWPDFYTDFTGDLWDKAINAPFDAGRMPGGWRAPSLSTPDPVTVGDAVANQIPPIAEEMGNMTNFTK